MNKSLIKGLGFAATLISIGASFINDWVNEKKMDETINNKINEILAKRN